MKNLLLLFTLFFTGLFSPPQESFAQWTAINTGLTNLAVLSFAAIPDGSGGTSLFAATDGGVFISTNNGTNWTDCGFTKSGAVPFVAIPNGTGGTKLIAATQEGVFSSSTYNGTTWSGWTAFDSGLDHLLVFALAVSTGDSGETNLFAGTWSQGVFLSTFNGTNWSSWRAVNSGLSHKKVNALAMIPRGTGGSSLFAATEGGGVFRTTNNGTTWQAVNSGLTDTSFFSLTASPNGTGGFNLYTGSYVGHVFLSTDGGAHWTELGAIHTYTTSIVVSGSNLFAATWGAGVYVSTNSGSSWNSVHSPAMNPYVWTITLSPDGAGGMNLFAGTEGNGAWRRPLSDMIPTSVNEKENTVPSDCSLEQNYPNPFNPATVISFSIGTYNHTSLQIFDVMGREVALLVSESLPAGHYTKSWNAESHPSGIYFCRLQSGSFTETRKLIVMR